MAVTFGGVAESLAGGGSFLLFGFGFGFSGLRGWLAACLLNWFLVCLVGGEKRGNVRSFSCLPLWGNYRPLAGLFPFGGYKYSGKR